MDLPWFLILVGGIVTLVIIARVVDFLKIAPLPSPSAGISDFAAPATFSGHVGPSLLFQLETAAVC